MTIEPIKRKPFSPWLRYPLLALSYSVGMPLKWLAEQTGLMRPWLRRVGLSSPLRTISLHSFDGYTPTEHDVFVCTYSKSGTNWAMQIAYQITMRGAGEYAHIHDVVPWPDGPPNFSASLKDDRLWQASPMTLRVIKTHLAWNYLPYSPVARYIWVGRDPKEVFVSTYYFTRDLIYGPLMPSLAFWLYSFTSGTFPYTDWAENFYSYWVAGEPENLLRLYYHEKAKDLRGTVARIAEFMGVTLTSAEFEEVCEKSSFAYMKSINHKFYTGAMSPLGIPDGEMVRRGKSGQSDELLSLAQQEAIDAYSGAKLKELGCDFPYAEVFGLAHQSGRGD